MTEETTNVPTSFEDSEDTPNSAEKNSGSSGPRTSDETSQPLLASEENDESDKSLTTDDTIEDEHVGEEDSDQETASTDRDQSIGVKKARSRAHLVLEYDLKDMYPEMNLLAETTKKEWNYHDPGVIRAIWLEAKTNALTEWKYKHSRIVKKKKPDIEVQMNHAVQLRQEFMERKKEREKQNSERNLTMTDIGREAPDFVEIKLPTTVTAEMRYKFNRDNPPVPKFYLHHFEKYKKPPFKTKVSTSIGCKPK